jgi:type II secretory pathway component PulJ
MNVLSSRQSKQQGFSLPGFLVIAMLLACLGAVLVQVVPTVLEYMAIKKAVKLASAETTMIMIRDRFDRSAQIENITSIGSKDLEIFKEGTAVVVAFSYEREIHLIGPMWLLFKYTGRSKSA